MRLLVFFFFFGVGRCWHPSARPFYICIYISSKYLNDIFISESEVKVWRWIMSLEDKTELPTNLSP